MAELKTPYGTIVGLIPEEMLKGTLQEAPVTAPAPKKRSPRKKAEPEAEVKAEE